MFVYDSSKACCAVRSVYSSHRVTHLIASASAIAIQHPLSLSFSCLRSLNQSLNTHRLFATSSHNLSFAFSDQRFYFVQFRMFVCLFRKKNSKVLKFRDDSCTQGRKSCIFRLFFKQFSNTK